MCGVVSITNESFSRLVQQYEPLVYTICFQLVRDAAAAEDLTQDTFLSAYIHRSSMPPGMSASGWAASPPTRPKTTCKAPGNGTRCCRETRPFPPARRRRRRRRPWPGAVPGRSQS